MLHLTGSRRGFAQARDFTHRTLDAWSLKHRADDALTVVTELAANAVLHALADLPEPEGQRQGAAAGARLRLSLRPHHLVCAVTDPSDVPPVYAHTDDPLLEHGRGLHIVEALSEHWGWTRRCPVGKTVWAMLPTHPSPLT